MADRPHEPDPSAPPTRPQPLGVLPLPLGYLLVPAGEDTDPARLDLLAGRIPASWPDRMRAHRLALAGDRAGALAALDAEPAPGPVTRYNRFVLDPDGAARHGTDPDRLRRELGELGVLVDLVLFALGRTDLPPGDPAGRPGGEIGALVLSARATHVLGTDGAGAAVALLERAAEQAAPVSPPLEGLLLAAAAGILRERGDVDCVPRFERALALLEDADGLRVGRAEVHLELAGALHEQADDRPDLLNRAVPHYHAALQLVRREDAALTWAAAHAGLATAYLTMPMVEASGQLRLGIAAQSLRAALTVYTRADHPAEWASLQLNLANSLVYGPTAHREENLVDAVEIYQAVLETRDRHSDPLGRARVLSNQGTVLAHLGAFDDAKARLYEARFLFEEHTDEASVRAVRGVLDEIARQVALARTAEHDAPAPAPG
ncbi:hypothetical protein GCM10009613_36330 [Pseudonocardia kongjuensis]|uniref:Tetratricopeptide repeat protein n=1 Tax=Pseudonocardia kongjuensis TaxID=102227 RepID=A0ABN1XX72_9PSEU